MAVGFYIFSFLLTVCIDLAAPIVCCIYLVQNEVFSDITFWNIWLFMRLVICIIDGVISLICISCMLSRISNKWLPLLLYILMETIIACYSSTAYFISEDAITQIHNTFIVTCFSNIIPAQYLELLVFFMILICFVISLCEKKSVSTIKKHTNNPNPTPITITMDQPLNVEANNVNTIDFSLDNDVHQPLLTEPIVNANEEISTVHLEDQSSNDNTVVILPTNQETSTVPQVVTIVDPPVVMVANTNSIMNNEETVHEISDLHELHSSPVNTPIPTVEIISDNTNTNHLEEAHIENVIVSVPSDNPSTDVNEQPPSLVDLPPPPTHKVHHPSIVNTNSALQPVIEEMNELVQSRNNNLSDNKGKTDSSEDCSSNPSSKQCSLCQKENATLKIDPCEDIFCTSCLTNTSRCPTCGCMICNVIAIE